jgi:hypothetical protein
VNSSRRKLQNQITISQSNCHPEQSEGSRCLPAAAMCVVKAKT